jgi:hypothetical protein
MDRVLSAAYQKDRARRRAFHQWELDYHLARAHNDLQVEATGIALDGAAYQYAISQPPSKHNHPLWSAAVAMEKDKRGRKTRRPLFTQRTTSTALQLAVDHAFTGSYVRKFRPLDPPPHSRALVAPNFTTLTTSSETAIFTTSPESPHSLPPTATHYHYHNSSPTRLTTLTDYFHLSIAPALLCVLLRLAGRYLLNRNPTEDSD